MLVVVEVVVVVVVVVMERVTKRITQQGQLTPHQFLKSFTALICLEHQQPSI